MGLLTDLVIGSVHAVRDIVRGPDPVDRSPALSAAAAGRAAARMMTNTRIGVSFSGGGAWGFAAMAFAERMLADKVEIDAVAGVSSGALVAGFLAWRPEPLGGTRPEGFNRLRAMRRAQLGALAPGALSLRPMRRWIESVTGATTLVGTPIPAYLGFTNVDDGAARIATQPCTLGEAMSASGAFPGVLGPVNFQGKAVADGAFGQVLVFPETLRQQGCAFVYSVNAFPRALTPGRLHPVYDLLVRICQPLRRTRDLQSAVMAMYGRVADEDAGFQPNHPGIPTGSAAWCSDYHWIAEPRDFETTDFHRLPEIADASLVRANAVLNGPTSPGAVTNALVYAWFTGAPKPNPVVVR